MDTPKLDAEFVNQYVESWESRHDAWVRDFFADALGSDKRTMNGIRAELKTKLENDWRVSLGFLVDRTTYQGGSRDVLNCRRGIYLFKQVCMLPHEFSATELQRLLEQIKDAKRTGRVTHLRFDRDIGRFESIAGFLCNSTEKNLTTLVLSKTGNANRVVSFLKNFRFIGDKTANFYLKFICWLFDLAILPIVVDRHVLDSLIRFGEIESASPPDAKAAILRISERLSVPPIRVETALYECGWLSKNNPNSFCS